MGYIIVGLDSSEASHRAFHQAVREAEWRGASVLALHNVSLPVTTGYEYARLIDDVQRIGREATEKELKQLEAHYDNGFPVEVTHTITTGHPGVQIIEAAKGPDGGEPAELVVLGSRGHGGFKGLLLGSVSTYAAHHLTCPLLIVPAPEDD